MRNSRPASWKNGIEAAYSDEIFVTPPVDGWVLVVGSTMGEAIDGDDGTWRAQLASLSTRFGLAQLFCTHRVVEMHVWARAKQGTIERAYGYLGESGETLFDEGEQTAEERALGLRFFDAQSPDAEEEGYWEREDLSYPDEETVMAIARHWSLAPIELSESSAEPALGLLGTLGGGATGDEGRPWWRFW